MTSADHFSLTPIDHRTDTQTSGPLNTESPCVKACKLNADKLCQSCGRDLDMIANWSTMSDWEKHLANEVVSQRQAQKN